jgi:ABC-type transport system substrate-binding protein
MHAARRAPRPGPRPAIAGALAIGVMLALCACDGVRDSPNATGAESRNVLYAAFDDRNPKYLDPTASYGADETPYVYLSYEPPYRFDYLKRPYVLAPRSAVKVVAPRYVGADGHDLPADAAPERIAESVYDIPIRHGILYAPHPAFARDASGNYLYHHLRTEEVAGKHRPRDFAEQGTRELVAADFVYAIRRLATTRIQSQALAVMEDYIIGMKQYAVLIAAVDQQLRAGLRPDADDLPFLDFRRYDDLPGAVALDDHTLRIRIKGKYPQFSYWLQMTFLSPVPWEADAFYAQPGMARNNLTLNFFPVGTGPFQVTDYVENRQITLDRNPNFHGEPYPCEGAPGDREAGLLVDCGKTMPFVDRIVARLEKEITPLETKFLQGFYDIDDIWRVDRAVKFAVDAKNSEDVARLYRERGIRLPQTPDVSDWYIGFNWWDPVVGKGDTPEQQVRNRKLRQAISIAINWEEFVQVFENRKAGVAAMGPLPPGIFGYREGLDGINRTVYDVVDGKPVRKSLEVARALMAEAGYPGGISSRTGRPLVLNYDYQRTLTPELKSEVDWVAKQFAKVGVQLEIRATDYNRFQDKMNNGTEQVFWWGWKADYPDAENFLFLLYGPGSRAATHGNGQNDSNYVNPEYDRLYERFRYLEDGPEKQALIDQMVRILHEDAPWSWGFFPLAYNGYHDWVFNGKPAPMVMDKLEYLRLDPQLRAAEVARWNRPVWWPLLLLAGAVALAVVPAVIAWRRRERMTAARTLAAGT